MGPLTTTCARASCLTSSAAVTAATGRKAEASVAAVAEGTTGGCTARFVSAAAAAARGVTEDSLVGWLQQPTLRLRSSVLGVARVRRWALHSRLVSYGPTEAQAEARLGRHPLPRHRAWVGGCVARVCALRSVGESFFVAPRELKVVLRAAAAQAETTQDNDDNDDNVPLPVVAIDQHSEENATVVELEFGDRLGALLDTMAALRALGLNVVKAKVTTEASVGRNRFVITESGGKVRDPEMLEAIRGTIISKLLEFHPESKARLAMAQGLSGQPEVSAASAAVETRVLVKTLDDGERSELYVETADHPGLLLEIMKVLRDLSINVDSAEIDTEGLVAKDFFYVTYHGKSLDSNMQEVVKNALQYELSRREIEMEESY